MGSLVNPCIRSLTWGCVDQLFNMTTLLSQGKKNAQTQQVIAINLNYDNNLPINNNSLATLSRVYFITDKRDL